MQHPAPHKFRLKLLAIGFLPPPLGGVSVSFKTFCDIATSQGKVDLKVINLSGTSREGSFARNVMALARRIWVLSRIADVVVLYCATTQVATIGLVTLAVCRLRGKPFVLRKAANMDYRDLGAFRGRVAGSVVKHADLFLAQTKQLTQLCQDRGLSHTKWFPTSRPLGPLRENRGECRRFVYIGQVRPSKGAFELTAAAERLPETASLDVYGPFYDGIDAGIFHGLEQIAYKGTLEPGEVVPTLQEYDAFVLPSKARSEGYPGAILEAYSVGMPVIATTVGGIPEIVDERCGILIEPGDTEALVRAMHRLVEDREVYRTLCRGARESREHYSAEYWTNWLVNECIELGKRKSERI